MNPRDNIFSLLTDLYRNFYLAVFIVRVNLLQIFERRTVICLVKGFAEINWDEVISRQLLLRLGHPLSSVSKDFFNLNRVGKKVLFCDKYLLHSGAIEIKHWASVKYRSSWIKTISSKKMLVTVKLIQQISQMTGLAESLYFLITAIMMIYYYCSIIIYVFSMQKVWLRRFCRHVRTVCGDFDGSSGRWHCSCISEENLHVTLPNY